jgi:hypothetical protein
LSHGLDKNLRAIAGEGSLEDIVFKLIQTANSQGWVEDLVRAARKSNPKNRRLRDLVMGIQRVNIQGNKELLNIPVVGNEASEQGLNYTELRDFLINQQFYKADYETARLMLLAARRESEGGFELDDVLNFPVKDLATIDKLWLSRSNGKFGFSVQKQILMELRKGNRSRTVKESFIKALEWREETPICYELRAVKGHLPIAVYEKLLEKDKFLAAQIKAQIHNEKLFDREIKNIFGEEDFENKEGIWERVMSFSKVEVG